MSSVRTGSDGGVQVHVSVMLDETPGSQLAHTSGDPSHAIQCAVNDA